MIRSRIAFTAGETTGLKAPTTSAVDLALASFGESGVADGVDTLSQDMVSDLIAASRRKGRYSIGLLS
jgi:hypothetical protein